MNSTKENKIPINPSRTCDVVMKSGVTSGIVYPKAMYQMATDYRFVNIGGTSAGAIAASLTAAAEYNRRETGSAEGFEKLLQLPINLTEEKKGSSKLFSLFKPNKSTEKISYIFMNIYNQKNKFRKYLASLSALTFSFPILSIIFCYQVS